MLKYTQLILMVFISDKKSELEFENMSFNELKQYLLANWQSLTSLEKSIIEPILADKDPESTSDSDALH